MRVLFRTAVIALATSVSASGAQVINEDFKLIANDGGQDNLFGSSIAINNGIVAVGADSDDDNGSGSGSAYLFDASTGIQLLKLLPNDGDEEDRFGNSIAIENGVVAVGAFWDEENGTDSGSVYLFNAVTGAQIRKLLPNDGNAFDRFGISIAISDGIVAVGANGDDDFGNESGSVYLFRISTGAQIAKLIPNDGAPFDFFGISIAISGDVVAVGARNDDDNGSNSGSAYLFNASTGSQTAKLLPNDAAAFDRFGQSIAIDNNIVAVGANDDDDNGNGSGSIYLFDRITGDQIAKLLPNDGNAGDRFGHSIAIDNGIVIVGARDDDDNGSNSGSAYTFDVSTGTQIAKLLPSDGAGGSGRFGQSVAIHNGAIAVGADRDSVNGLLSGSAYVFKAGVDTDGDGLLDDWETEGIPYSDGKGAKQHFMLPGADPMHKDLYVEVDAMAGLSLSNVAVTQLQTVFANSPLSNPDEVSGITLHILQDDTDLLHLEVWQTNGCWPLDFDTFRSTNYGTIAERDHPDRKAMLDAKSMAYRYCIVADRADDPSTPEVDSFGGCGERPGDNFVIFIGGGGYNSEDEAAVFLHELGHNLNLQHGGGDDINGKTNYPSIMNYPFSYRYRWNRSFWRLDYSRQDAGHFVSLDETMLDETVGVGTPTGFYNGIWMPYGIFEDDGAGNNVRKVKYLKLDGRVVDFGSPNNSGQQDGMFTTDAVQDLNYVTDGDNVPPGIPDEPSFPEMHIPYDDWANISLQLAAAIGPGAPAPTFATDELTNAGRDWVETNLTVPAGVCQADLTGDGSLNFFDVSAFLTAFGVGDAVADFTGDGVFNFFDVSAFLSAFAAGCP